MPLGQQAINPVINLIPFIVIFIIFYFLLIRPQKLKEKGHQNMLSNLKKNDAIVTSSGMYGTIVNVKDRTVVLRIDDNVKIEIEKNSVAYINKQQSANSET